MNPTLQSDKNSFAQILRSTLDVAERYVSAQEKLSPGMLVDDLPTIQLPEKGLGANEVLKQFEKKYSALITNSAGPRYFGFVTGGSTPASVAGDWLVSTYDQNACGSNDSIAPQIERQAIDFIRQLLGINNDFFGSFVTGATMSNMVGLSQARQWVGEQQGFDFSNDGISGKVTVLSGTPHSTILKSLSMIGVGRKNVTYIKVLDGREAVDVSELEKELKSGGVAIVVANAGTVNTVDFDDLVAIGKLKEKCPFWLHVDAAFGGFAGASPKYRHLVEGINYADSICVDAHKWLNVPYDAAMQFTRHKKIQLKIFQNAGAAYLSDPEQSTDFFHYTPETSRRFRALPAWFSLMAYGREGHAEIVERNCRLAIKLGAWLDQSDKFTLLAPVRMNVVCFTLSGNKSAGEVKSFLDKIREDGRAYFTPTTYKGTPAIRAAVSNWLTSESDIDVTTQALQELA